MKRVWRWTIRITGLIVGLAVLAGVVLYLGVVRPIKVHQELCERQSAGGPVSEDQLRSAAHAALRWVPDHDAFITLTRHGDESSIPVLIRSLARVRKPDKDELVVCASAHCLDALRGVSGTNFGYDVGAWKHWAGERKIEP